MYPTITLDDISVPMLRELLRHALADWAHHNPMIRAEARRFASVHGIALAVML